MADTDAATAREESPAGDRPPLGLPRPRRRRRKLLRALAVVVLLVFAWQVWVNAPAPTLSTTVPPPQRPPAQHDLPWISTWNGRFVDDSGRFVVLRGFNQDSLLTWPSWQPAPMDAEDAAMMEKAGFNVVRLPIDWSQLEPTRGQIDTAYLDRVASTVAMLNQHHLYVVLDMHFSLDWGPRFGGTGAPTWAVVRGVPDSVITVPNASWKVSPGILAANTYFWTSQDWQRDFIMTWQAVATRFRDDSGVVGYDLYNEPESTILPPHIFEEQWMWPLFVRTIDGIGAVDSNHVFMVEGILLWDFATTMDIVQAPNLVFAPHLYTGALVPPTYDQAPWLLPQSIDQKLGEARQLPATPWIGELGIDFSKSFALRWIDAVVNSLEQRGVGWAWWQWRDIPTWGIRSPDGRTLNTTVLRHLARPFVSVYPKGVGVGQGNGIAGTLSVPIEAGHGSQPVVISWPELTLGTPVVTPDPCIASTKWDASTARLEVQLVPGRACTLRVHAAGANG